MKKVLLIIGVIGIFLISSTVYACVCDYQYNHQTNETYHYNCGIPNCTNKEYHVHETENSYHYDCGVPNCTNKEYHVHENPNNYHHANQNNNSNNNYRRHRSCHHN